MQEEFYKKQSIVEGFCASISVVRGVISTFSLEAHFFDKGTKNYIIDVLLLKMLFNLEAALFIEVFSHRGTAYRNNKIQITSIKF